MPDKDYLSVLNPEQYKAVTHEGSPLLILAGAGSGKTRVITTKIAWLIKEKNINPRSILAVTFTKKAAAEMKERAIAIEERASASQIRTFHSFGAWFLRNYGDIAGLSENFTVYDDDDALSVVKIANPDIPKKMASFYARKISLAKDYCLTPKSESFEEISDENFNEVEWDKFREVYAAYEKCLRADGNADFGDLIMLPEKILRENEVIRRNITRRFEVIMVDEYQDSNIAQFKLLRALSGYDCNGGIDDIDDFKSYVCVVGDDDQSIYKFRGAEVKNILNFKEYFPGTQIIRLEKNYRSRAEILEVAHEIISNNEGRLGKTLSAERGSGKLPVLAFLPNQDEEASFCADLIEQTHENGTPYSEWAILYRTNAQSLTFETTFLHRKIPFTVVGTLKFYEREEVKDLLAFLALIANPKSEVAFRRIVNKPARGIGGKTLNSFVESARASNSVDFVEFARMNASKYSKKAAEGFKTFVQMMDDFKKLLAKNKSETENTENSQNKLPAEERTLDSDYSADGIADEKDSSPRLSLLIEEIAEKSGLKEYYATGEGAEPQRIFNMQELANSAIMFKCSFKGLVAFLDSIELDRALERTEDEDSTGEEKRKDRVTLITLHNTKGLEFKRVVMTGMELDVFPRMDKIDEELEEERRLCYVGVTRAQNELYLTSCASRRLYGQVRFMLPSTFLKEIDKNSIKIIGHVPSSFREKNITSSFKGGDFGKNGLSHPEFDDPIKEKYSLGTKIFHDDYGYGVVVKTEVSDEEEYIISVSFENSGIKKFFPQYQEKSLMVVKD